jgi:hypothetical protein
MMCSVIAAGFLQALLLQAAAERMRRLMPRLQAKLSKLQGDMELAKARCQASLGELLVQTQHMCTMCLVLIALQCSLGSGVLAQHRDRYTEVIEAQQQQHHCRTSHMAGLVRADGLECRVLLQVQRCYLYAAYLGTTTHAAMCCHLRLLLCCSDASGGSRRAQQVLQQLQQLSCAIREELSQVVDGKVQQQQQISGALAAAPEQQLDSARGIDQSVSAAFHNSSSSDTPRKKAAAGAGASLQDSSSAMMLAGGDGTTWDDASKSSAAAAAAGVTAVELQPLAGCRLMAGYVPSQGVQGTVLQLLQEAPELLLSCSSQLAAQASQELTDILDEAETALLAPLVWEVNAAAAAQEAGSAAKAQQQGLLAAAADVQAAAAAACPYTLPWTIPWQTSITQQQQAAAAGAFRTPEMLVKDRQQQHVQYYLQTKAAAAAAAAAETHLEQLMGTVPLLNGTAAGSWETQLARLWLRAEGLRAEVAVLRRWEDWLKHDVEACQQVRAVRLSWRGFLFASGPAELGRLLWAS